MPSPKPTTTSPTNIVIVPDMLAIDLIAATKRELNLTYLDSEYAAWDYYRGVDGTVINGRGKKFEVMVWKPELKPGERITSEAVRSHLRELGFHGHTGAFTAWRKTCALSGYHASIPEDNSCWRHSDGRLCVPSSDFDGGLRGLYRDWLGNDWSGRCSFVAFREIS